MVILQYTCKIDVQDSIALISMENGIVVAYSCLILMPLCPMLGQSEVDSIHTVPSPGILTKMQW